MITLGYEKMFTSQEIREYMKDRGFLFAVKAEASAVALADFCDIKAWKTKDGFVFGVHGGGWCYKTEWAGRILDAIRLGVVRACDFIE